MGEWTCQALRNADRQPIRAARIVNERLAARIEHRRPLAEARSVALPEGAVAVGIKRGEVSGGDEEAFGVRRPDKGPRTYFEAVRRLAYRSD